MVIGEAKTPVKASVTWADGATDIMHYQKSIPEMFVPNILTLQAKEENYSMQVSDVLLTNGVLGLLMRSVSMVHWKMLSITMYH